MVWRVKQSGQCNIAFTTVQATTDAWYPDRGCFKHMTGNRSFFSELKECTSGHVMLGDDAKGRIIAKGNIEKYNLPCLNDVRYVERLKENLISLINLKNRHSFMGEKSFVQKVVFDGPPKEDAKANILKLFMLKFCSPNVVLKSVAGQNLEVIYVVVSVEAVHFRYCFEYWLQGIRYSSDLSGYRKLQKRMKILSKRFTHAFKGSLKSNIIEKDYSCIQGEAEV
ncbi:uncharacterized protein E5676_scaffold943G00090 [Cucumis melo var. makuwa]|uniref:Retrovirus-related Pol polyprotein from transposon TNT 1-94-like beta-barrel domain-containing protein n=1 Tax=Cucumis melo var. makuwa TaxID=1194695 RepID=A0A5A7VDT2_CUCMM|nr:uncharacterized protein E6C27_scaffold37G001480 [Cucumis melo var. makuwa]TYK24047.1 uncharacterized protein E5676_scaffold943G00090 [Cucumis melo var. makuwa]